MGDYPWLPAGKQDLDDLKYLFLQKEISDDLISQLMENIKNGEEEKALGAVEALQVLELDDKIDLETSQTLKNCCISLFNLYTKGKVKEYIDIHAGIQDWFTFLLESGNESVSSYVLSTLNKTTIPEALKAFCMEKLVYLFFRISRNDERKETDKHYIKVDKMSLHYDFFEASFPFIHHAAGNYFAFTSPVAYPEKNEPYSSFFGTPDLLNKQVCIHYFHTHFKDVYRTSQARSCSIPFRFPKEVSSRLMTVFL